MSQASSQGNSVIFDSTQPGYSVLASGNTNLLSSPANMGNLSSFALQIITDGGASVDYFVQATIIARTPVSRGVKILGTYGWRDDAYTSNMWSNIATGNVPANVGNYQGALITVPVSNYKFIRVAFNWNTGNTAGTTANIWACIHGTGA